MVIRCVLPTWWLLRGGCTRSHSEHGRETPQRQWYSVLRRGRVGRCQVCKTQRMIKQSSQSHSFGPADTKGRVSGLSSFKAKLIRQTLSPLSSTTVFCQGKNLWYFAFSKNLEKT